MKFSLSLGFLAIASVDAFAPTSFGVRSSTTLNSVGRVDTSEAIKAAMAASKEFGATSVEARMAWEAVEEMDAADTRYVPIVLFIKFGFLSQFLTTKYASSISQKLLETWRFHQRNKQY